MKKRYERQVLVVVGALAVIALVAAALGSQLWVIPALAAFLGSLTLSDTKVYPRLYRVRYNTKNDGTRDFWRVIDDKGVEHAADKIESKARMETETLVVDGVLKGNVVIWASDFYTVNSVAYFR